MKKLTFIILLQFIVLGSSLVSKTMQLSDTNGNQITAKLLDVHVQGVDLELDGRIYRGLGMDTFSKESQDKIKAWQRERMLNNIEQFLSIRTLTKSGSKTKTTEPVTVVGGRVYDKGKEITTWPAYYRVIIENDSEKTFRDITVEYRIYKGADAMRYHEDQTIKLDEVKGSHKILSLAPRKEYSFDTEPMEMKEEKFLKGIRTVGESDKKAEDELYGIWLKVYLDGNVVYELSNPRSLASDQVW